jgi:hypothetical protein
MSDKPFADGDLPDDDPEVIAAIEALSDDDPEIVAGMERLAKLRALERHVLDFPSPLDQS